MSIVGFDVFGLNNRLDFKANEVFEAGGCPEYTPEDETIYDQYPNSCEGSCSNYASLTIYTDPIESVSGVGCKLEGHDSGKGRCIALVRRLPTQKAKELVDDDGYNWYGGCGASSAVRVDSTDKSKDEAAIVQNMKDSLEPNDWSGWKNKDPPWTTAWVDMRTKNVNCEVSGWGAWSDCDPVSLTKTRTRTIITEPTGTGEACDELEETESCVLSVPEKVDCKVTNWSEWSACSDGNMTRSRTIETPVSGGGAECPTPLTETQTCSEGGEPVDCKVSSWSDWSMCSDDTQERSRAITTQPSNGGKSCPNLGESKTCGEATGMVLQGWAIPAGIVAALAVVVMVVKRQ